MQQQRTRKTHYKHFEVAISCNNYVHLTKQDLPTLNEQALGHQTPA